MVTRANVEATKSFIRERVGNPYVYGGALSGNVNQGTDCSEVWQTVLEMVHGRWKPGRQSEGATTESYRYITVGGVGPFGTIRVAHWRDIPANAAAKLAFHHGPGGGANSHMWGDLDGMLIESGGSKGLVTNGRALTVENSYATAWAYLPGPIDGVAGPPPPLGLGSVGAEVVALQTKLNAEGAGLEVDGEYGQKTADAVVGFNRRAVYGRAVLAEGQRRGISPRGIQITFTVPFVESNWKMYANAKVPESMHIPHDAVGADYDSVGLFQQRCPMWGPAAVLMDPTKSAGLFYDRLQRLEYNDLSRYPGDIAADIQRPAAQYRGRYQEHWGHAQALYNRLTTTTDELDEWEALMADNTPYPSTSPYRADDKPVLTLRESVRQTNGMVHAKLIEDAALQGHPGAIAAVAKLAQGQGPGATDLFKVEQAKNIIRTIQASIAAQLGAAK